MSRGRWAPPALAAAVAAIATGGLALAQPQPAAAPPPAAAPATPPAADEAPPPTATPPASAIVEQPAPPAPASEIAPPPPAPKPRAQEAAKPAPPAPKRALYNAAVLQALDKVTTETLRFEAQLNRPVRYKGLIFTVHTCQVEPAGVRPPAEAHLEIISQPQNVPGRQTPPARLVYRGWMFADAPGVHPFEHPVYDVWLIACKTASPVNAGSR